MSWLKIVLACASLLCLGELALRYTELHERFDQQAAMLRLLQSTNHELIKELSSRCGG